MKVWIECMYLRYTVGFFYRLHGTEPTERPDAWRSKYGGINVCTDALVELGFDPLPVDDELFEYDLSGKKPRYVCTWEAA